MSLDIPEIAPGTGSFDKRSTNIRISVRIFTLNENFFYLHMLIFRVQGTSF